MAETNLASWRSSLTKLLDQAFKTLSLMPAETQDDIARALLGMAEPDAPSDIEPEHLEAVMEGIQQAERGEFAAGNASEIVDAAFRRHAR